MHTQLWGPFLWYILHLISFEYPEHPTEYDKRMYHDFYTSLKEVLPCIECKKHYREHITRYPLTPHLDSRDSLIKWVIQIHNFVNISLNKPTYTHEQIKYIYSNINPISPFASIDKSVIKKMNQQKEYHRLYIFIFLAFIIILISKYYFSKYYFSFY